MVPSENLFCGMMLKCVVLLLLPLLVQSDLNHALDCQQLYSQGQNISRVYTTYPQGVCLPVDVYCDMGSANNKAEGGGWTVFQRRVDGTLNFYRPWQQYKEGFGNASGEYWLGLETLHLLTRYRKHELRVDMEDFEGKKVFAKYSTFSVGPEDDGYKLTVSGFTDGGAGDSLAVHNGMKFTTFDKDQDAWDHNCAVTYLGAYWYQACHHSNPNGLYMWGPTTHFAIGVNWEKFKGYHYSLKSITMKIRPVP